MILLKDYQTHPAGQSITVSDSDGWWLVSTGMARQATFEDQIKTQTVKGTKNANAGERPARKK